VHGFGQEVYKKPFPKACIGWRFGEVAADVFNSMGVTVFAMIDPFNHIVLSPVEYLITGEPGEEAYMLADSEEEAEDFSHFEPNFKTPPNTESAHSENIVEMDMFTELPRNSNLSSLHDHVIVCGNVTGLASFVLPLRETTLQPVVILHPQAHRGDRDWDEVMGLPNVFHCAGSAMRIEDLHAAGAQRAETVVILSDETGFFVQHANRSADAFAIFVANSVEEYFDCRWVVEVVEEQSIRQLKTPSRPNDPYALWPRYCSADVYIATMLDCLVAQCFYNRELLEVLSAVVGLDDEDDNAVLQQVPMPKSFVGQRFHALFTELSLHHGMIPLGLYRAPASYEIEGEDGEEDEGEDTAGQLPCQLPFVLTNPDPQTVLHEDDLIFICAHVAKPEPVVVPPSQISVPDPVLV